MPKRKLPERTTLWDTLEPDPSHNIYCQRADLGNEASVEDRFVSRMLRDLGYPDAQIRTKENVATRNVGKGRKREDFRPDYLLVASSLPRCVVDAKATTEDLGKWVDQCSSYCLQLNKEYPADKDPVRYFVLSNGITTQVYNWNSAQPVLTLAFADFNYGNPKYEQFKTILGAATISKARRLSDLSKAQESFLFTKPSAEQARQLFQTCHQTIWKSEGIAPGPAFMEFVKVMFVKLYCDRQLRESDATRHCFHEGETDARLPKSGMTFTKAWIEAREKESVSPIDSPLFANLRHEIELNVQQRKKKRLFDLDERIQLRPDTIKRIVEKLEHYDMFGIDEDLNGRLFETFLSATMRGRNLGQFFTPRSIVKMMTRIADLQVTPGHQDRVIDACCGSGGFLIEALTLMRNTLRANTALTQDQRDKLMDTIANECLYGIDFGKDPPLARIARINMYLHGDGGSRIYLADSLDKDVVIGPDLEPEVAQNMEELRGKLVEPGFDVALTNPPFSMTKEARNDTDKVVLARYALAHRDETSDSLRPSLKSSQMFLERYHDLLRPGGRLITVIDDTLLASDVESFRYTRDFLRKHFIIRAIISLPGDAFRRQDARVKTSVLIMEKKLRPDEQQPSCFAYFSEYIGVDDLTPRAHEREIIEARSKAENETTRIIAGYKAYLSGRPPKDGAVLPASRIMDRLDLKSCVPQIGRMVPVWRNMGAEVRLMSDCVKLHVDLVLPSEERPDEVFTWIRVGYDGICQIDRIIEGKSIKYDRMYRVRKGQMVFSTIRASDGAIGIVPEEFDGALVSCNYSVFDVGPEDYDTAYLWAILRSHELRADMQSLSPGSGRYHTYWEDVATLQIPWLDTEDRKAIGRTLIESWDLERKVDETRSVALAKVASLGVESASSVNRWKASKAPT